MSMNYKNTNLLTFCLLMLGLLAAWFGASQLQKYVIALQQPIASASATSNQEQDITPGTAASSPYSRRDVASTAAANSSAYPADDIESLPLDTPANLALFAVLTEIGKRLAEEQYQEAENELNALIDTFNLKSDVEKSVFLDFYLDYTSNNAFEAEAVTAFDQLWTILDMSPGLRMESSRRLGLHYVEKYELALAIPLLELALSPTDTMVLQNLSHAYFGMHQYQQAIPYLLQTIDSQFSQNLSVERQVFSELFEAYYRLGDLENAETVGVEILAQFNDIQDWKDMQQFYESTGDSSGLKTHLENASSHGFMSRDQAWIE